MGETMEFLRWARGALEAVAAWAAVDFWQALLVLGIIAWGGFIWVVSKDGTPDSFRDVFRSDRTGKWSLINFMAAAGFLMLTWAFAHKEATGTLDMEYATLYATVSLAFFLIPDLYRYAGAIIERVAMARLNLPASAAPVMPAAAVPASSLTSTRISVK